VTVVAVIVIGLVVVVGPALPHLGSLYKDPFAAQREQRIVENFDAGGNKTGTVITTAPVGSLIERRWPPAVSCCCAWRSSPPAHSWPGRSSTGPPPATSRPRSRA